MRTGFSKFWRIMTAGILPAVLFAHFELEAQVAWESPMLMAPAQPGGFGVYLTDPDPGSGIGALLTWRSAGSPSSLGFRIGLAEGYRGELAASGGVDFQAPIHSAGASFPLDVVVVAGIGAGVGEYGMVSLPFGVTLGRVLTFDGVRFTPYVTPRLSLDGHMGGRRPRRGADLELIVDLGADISFDPAWAIRFGASFGGRNALAIGVALPGGAR